MPDKSKTVRRSTAADNGGTSQGPSTDARNRPVVDPTPNVISLVLANAETAELLRKADEKYNDKMHCHLKEIGTLRAEHAETLRVSDLDRLDKTRQVDVLAATASASALATAVQTLANTSDRNAETLRNLVNATAQTMAKQTTDQAQVLSTQTDSLVKGINDRIAELQKAQYQGAGKSSIVDPAIEALTNEVRKLSRAQDERAGKQAVTDPVLTELAATVKLLVAAGHEGGGKTKGISLMGALAIGASLVIVNLITGAMALYAVIKPAPVQPVAVPIVAPAVPK